MICVHCGMGLTVPIGGGLYGHVNHLQRCQGGPDGSVPYGHMGHPTLPCPPGVVNPCMGFIEGNCDHVTASPSTGEADG